MAEYDLYKLAALDETVSHFFFPALALHQRRYFSSVADDDGDEESGEASEYTTAEDLEPIRIPDTILYSYSKPILWFYYDEATKRIARRPSKMLNTASIMEHFTETSKSKIGVRAWFVYPQEPELILPQTSDFLVDVVSQEAIGRTGVLRFLQSPKGKGILQHYVDNKTESDGSMKNVYIRCDYSPSHFSTDLLVSNKALNTPAALTAGKSGGNASSSAGHHGGGGGRAAGVSLALRFSPYASQYDRRPLVSSVMTTRLRNVCVSIAHRLKRLLSYTVASMHVVCRMDADDQLYILWCGSVRLHCKRYAHLSFRLSPQGTVHEPYNLTERAREVAEHQQQQQAAANNRQQQHIADGAGSSAVNAHAPSKKNDNDDDNEDDVSRDEEAASLIVMQLLSNLAPKPKSSMSQKSGVAVSTNASGRASREGERRSPRARRGNSRDGGGVAAAFEGAATSGSVVSSSQRTHQQPLLSGDSNSNKTSDEDDMIPCCICKDVCQRGALVKVHLQWVLFCLSLMDRAAAAQAAWNGVNDVPPSVALACPNLSRAQFDRLVQLDKQRTWLRTYVGICVMCVSDCNKANERMCEQRMTAPSWIGVDKNYVPPSVAALERERRMSRAHPLPPLVATPVPSAGHSSTTQPQPRLQRKASQAVKLAEMLTYFHHTHAEETANDTENMSRLKALVSTSATASAALEMSHQRDSNNPRKMSEGTSRTRKSITAISDLQQRRGGFQLRASVSQWLSHPAISFVGSTREFPDAADLYKSEDGVWQRCGFGRPLIDARYVPPVPHVYSVCFLDLESTKRQFLGLVDSLSNTSDDERSEALQSRFRAVAAVASASTDCPDVPCHTPV
ncbi:Hypothetical protein, putative [Bodo saltans]|uniref:Uncharacterized protein n=1 Tax=Bodo saltans TaxID=75058 RepID=A0A0S4J5G8_BODSA|nr:Hypothetical protein, putative [Bodo saltans]|eukprot:CUG59957.1 Hypothetical protein, putative [Bodo saltans]